MEGDSERKDQRIQELQRLLGGMEKESAALRETIRSREEELGSLRKMRDEGRQGEERSVNSPKYAQGRNLSERRQHVYKPPCGLSEPSAWRRRWPF